MYSTTLLYLAINFSSFQVLSVDHHDSIDRIAVVYVINEVPLAQVNRNLSIGSGFLKNLYGDHKSQSQVVKHFKRFQ